MKSLRRVRLVATPWTAAYQAPPSMGFSRQEYWSGLPLPSPLLRTTHLLLCFTGLKKSHNHSWVQQGRNVNLSAGRSTLGVAIGILGTKVTLYYSNHEQLLLSPDVHARVLSRVWLCDSIDCNPPGSSVLGIFQARILEWVAISFPRGSSQLRDRNLHLLSLLPWQAGSLPLSHQEAALGNRYLNFRSVS